MDLFIQDLQRYPANELQKLAAYLKLNPYSNTLTSDIAAEQYRLHAVKQFSANLDPFDELFFEAVERGDIDTVTAFLNKGIDVNVKDSVGNTALINAIELSVLGINTIETIKVLLEHGANPNVQGENRWTALTLADDPQVIKLLLNYGADINLPGSNGLTALMEAAKERDVELVKMLLDRGANINQQDIQGYTALFHAVKNSLMDNSNVKVVKLLLERGADVDLKTKKGTTIQYFVKQSQDPEIIRLFIPTDWYNSCSDAKDIISQETWEDLTKSGEIKDPVRIHFPDRVECGERSNFIKVLETAPRLTIWMPNPDVIARRWLQGEPIIDDNGYGGLPVPDGPEFVKLTPYYYVLVTKGLFEDGKLDYKAELVNPEPVRYGNIHASFDASEQHGQIPGILVYKLVSALKE